MGSVPVTSVPRCSDDSVRTFVGGWAALSNVSSRAPETEHPARITALI